MTLGELCNRNVVIARPDELVTAAAQLMKTHHVGNLVAVSEHDAKRVPIGILTDRDVALSMDRVLQNPQLKVADLMSVDLVTATVAESLSAGLEKMRAHGVRRLPVVNERGELEGIVTFDDLVELVSEELADLVALVVREQHRERSTS